MEHTTNHDSRAQASDDSRTAGQRLRKFAAVLEVLGIYIAGQLVGFVLASIIGFPLSNPLTPITPDVTPAQLLAITGNLLIVLALQYSGWLALAFAIGWWHRRRKPEQYGVTLNKRSVGTLVLAGVLLMAFAELPIKLIDAISSAMPLGESIAWREALLHLDWSRPEYWLLMAVGSFGLVPIVEELFYRGYVQTRLEEDFGGPVAILATAFLFALSHSQYYILNALNISILLASIFSAVAWGYVFYRTRSLLVTIVAHALINFPVRGAIAVWAIPLIMLVICLAYRRQLGGYTRDFVAEVRNYWPGWQLVLVTAMFGLFAAAFVFLNDMAILAGLLFFIAAIALEWLDRRRARAAASP